MLLKITNNADKIKALNAYVSATNAAHQLREAKHISHVTKSREQKQFNKLNNALLESLLYYEKEMEKLDKVNPEAFEDVFNYFREMILEVSGIPIDESDEFRFITKAFKKDKKSLLGIAKKVLTK